MASNAQDLPAGAPSSLEMSDDDMHHAVRRSSKVSASTAASSVVEFDEAAFSDFVEHDSGATGGSSSSKRTADGLTSPRVQELRLATELSGRGNNGQKSPNSPVRKMLVSTPVSGNCDFHGIMPPHHTRRLSSRSASSPRLVLSGMSPKPSSTNMLGASPKISPREDSGPPRSSTPSKSSPKFVLSPGEPAKPRSGPQSRRTSSGTVFLHHQATAFEASEYAKRVYEFVQPLSLDTSKPDVTVQTGESIDSSRNNENDGVSALGLGNEVGVAAKNSIIESIRDLESEGTGGDSSSAVMTQVSDGASVDPDAHKRTMRNFRRHARRASDPNLPYSSQWASYQNMDLTSASDTESNLLIGVGTLDEATLIRPVAVRMEVPSDDSSVTHDDISDVPSNFMTETPSDFVADTSPIEKSVTSEEMRTKTIESPGRVAAMVAAIEEKTSAQRNSSCKDSPSSASPYPSPSLPLGQAPQKPRSPFIFPSLVFSKSTSSRSGVPYLGGTSTVFQTNKLPFSTKTREKAQAAPGSNPSSPPRSSFSRRFGSPSFGPANDVKASNASRALSPPPKILTGALFGSRKPSDSAPISLPSALKPVLRSEPVLTTGTSHQISPPAGLGLQRAVSLDEQSLTYTYGESTRQSSLPIPIPAHASRVEEVPIYHVPSGLSVKSASVQSTSTIKREKSPTTSPTMRSKRRASFNLGGFDVTLAAFKHKFKRKNSTATRESTSTPNSPIFVEDRRTIPSVSMTSMFSEESEEGFDSSRLHRTIKQTRDQTPSFSSTPAFGRFELEEPRHFDPLEESEDEDLSEAEEERYAEAQANARAVEEEDVFAASGIRQGTVEEIFKTASDLESRSLRRKILESLFFSAADMMDPAGEQMTIKVLDHVEDVGCLDSLDLWLTKFRAMEKLRFYDPSVSARIREVMGAFIGDSDNPGLDDHAQSSGAATKDDIRRMSERSDDLVVEDPTNSDDMKSMVQLSGSKNRSRPISFSVVSSSSSSSSDEDESNEDELDTDEETALGPAYARQRQMHIAAKLLRRLNRCENEVTEPPVHSNEWETDFDEQRGAKGTGFRNRRHSESDAIHHYSAAETVSHLRRASSLPYLFLWSEPPAQTPARARQYSTSSYGSFSARSGSHLMVLSPRSNRLKEAEEEEICLMEMLAYVVAPPLPPYSTSGSASQASTVTATTAGSPPPPDRVASINKQILLAQLQASTRRRRSTEGTEADRKEVSIALQHHEGADHHASFDVPEEQLSPKSFAMEARVSGGWKHVAASRIMHKRQHSASQGSHSQASLGLTPSQPTHHHSKQLSTSSLQTLLLGGPRRMAVSSSFSSFIEAETLSLPDKALRGDIKRYDPEMVARQLMITMCRNAYFQLTAQALRTVDARKRDDSVQRMVRFFEVLSNWPVTEILCDPKRTASDRIDDFGWFVSLAASCRELGNYHAVFAIVGGLQSPLLVWVANIAHRKDKRAFRALQRLARSENNYRIYKADLSKRDARLPCIPYLGLLNRSLLSLQCDTPVYLDEGHDIVNFVRIGRVRQVIVDYLRWQRNDMNVPRNGIYLDPCIRKALSESMSRSVLDYHELSLMSSQARKAFVTSIRQRAFHRARIFGQQIVRADEN